MATEKCPVCNVPVKSENLTKHLTSQHPNNAKAAAAAEKIRRQPKPRGTAKAPSRRFRIRAWHYVAVAVVIPVILAVFLVPRANTTTFDFFQSLVWVTVLVTTGAATLGGSVLAALLLVAAPTVFTSATFVKLQPVFFGVAAMLLAQAPNGVVGLFRRPDFAALGDRMEEAEHKVLGNEGFERSVDQVAAIEKQLGIYDLRHFSPLPG